MTIRLYVGNLPKESVERDDLHALFAETAGDDFTTKVIKDRKTGKCRGYAFVTVPSDEVADTLIEKFNGQSFMDSPLKIEKALPRTKGKKEEGDSGEEETPTPKSSPSKRRSAQKTTKTSSTQSGGSDPVQPDPRWADELSKLKEMLAAQK